MAFAFIFWIFFPDYPETAKWLTAEEKALQEKRLGTERSRGSDKITWAAAKDCLMDWRLYLHYANYVCVSCGVSSLSLFTPTIVNGLGYKNLQAQLCE